MSRLLLLPLAILAVLLMSCSPVQRTNDEWMASAAWQAQFEPIARFVAQHYDHFGAPNSDNDRRLFIVRVTDEVTDEERAELVRLIPPGEEIRLESVRYSRATLQMIQGRISEIAKRDGLDFIESGHDGDRIYFQVDGWEGSEIAWLVLRYPGATAPFSTFWNVALLFGALFAAACYCLRSRRHGLLTATIVAALVTGAGLLAAIVPARALCEAGSGDGCHYHRAVPPEVAPFLGLIVILIPLGFHLMRSRTGGQAEPLEAIQPSSVSG